MTELAKRHRDRIIHLGVLVAILAALLWVHDRFDRHSSADEVVHARFDRDKPIDFMRALNELSPAPSSLIAKLTSQHIDIWYTKTKTGTRFVCHRFRWRDEDLIRERLASNDGRFVPIGFVDNEYFAYLEAKTPTP